MWSPFWLPPKKVFLSPWDWPRREYIWALKWKESLLICFENCHGVPYFHRDSRNRMVNTFIIFTLPLHVTDSLEDKSMLLHSKKVFLLHPVWQGTEYTWALIWKKSLLICFGSYQGIFPTCTVRVDRRWWTLS